MKALLLWSIICLLIILSELPTQINSKTGGLRGYLVTPVLIDLRDTNELVVRVDLSRIISWVLESCDPQYHVKVQSHCDGGLAAYIMNRRHFLT